MGIIRFGVDILLPGPIISRHCLIPFPEAKCTNQATYTPFPSRLVRTSVGGDGVVCGPWWEFEGVCEVGEAADGLWAGVEG